MVPGKPPEESTDAHGPLPVIILVRDLLMGSRVTTAARRAGVATRTVRDPAGLTPEVAGRLAIVDLDLPGALAAGVAWGKEGGRPVAGFVQHVNTEVIREAKAAGVWPIVPRSRLEADLPGLLERGGAVEA